MTKQFKEIIKELRSQRGLTQEGLAQEMDVSKSSIAMWETGSRFPSKEVYEQLADLFNVDIDYLYGRTNIKKKVHFTENGDEYINANFVNENSSSYGINEETHKIAQEIFDDKDMELLFKLKKTAKADELMNYAKFLNEQYKKENNL